MKTSSRITLFLATLHSTKSFGVLSAANKRHQLSVNSTSRSKHGYLRRLFAGSLLLSCVICLPGLALAQTTFFKAYGGPRNDQANSVIPGAQGSLVAGGVVVAGFTETELANHSINKDAWVLWIKPDGTVRQGLKYGLEAADEVINEIEDVPLSLDSVGGYIAIGTRRMRTGTNTYSDILLIRIKPDGTLLWDKTYSTKPPPSLAIDKNGDEGLRVECDVLTREGHSHGFILSGRSQLENGTGGLTTSTSPNAYIIKVGTDGTPLWDKRFKDNGSQDDATFGDVRVTPAGYVFAGFNSPGTAADNDPFYGLLPANVDEPTATSPLTVTRYSQNHVHQGTYSILPLAPPNAGYFSVGNWRTTSSDMHLFALRMDSNLVAQSVHFYAHQNPSRQVRSDICKSAFYNDLPAIISPIFEGGATSDAGLILMKPNGEKIWARQYGTTRSDISLDACQGLDGNSFYAVGSTVNSSGNTDLLVIKTDREGKLNGADQGCSYLEDALTEKFPSPQTATVDLKFDPAYRLSGENDPNVVSFAPGPAGPCPHCTNPPVRMVGWWPLNEQTGATVVTDIQGGHNGTPSSGSLAAINAKQGKVGGGQYFHSTSLNVSVPDDLSLQFGTGNFSVDAWYSIKSLQIQGIVDKLDTGSKKGYAFYIQNNRLKLVMGNGTSFTTYISTAQVNITNTPFIWHHVAVTVDRESRVGKFYIDGVAGQSFPILASSIDISTASPLLIGGSRQTFTSCVCEYMLDEVEIFNGVVSANDIQAIFNAGPAGKCRPT